MQYKMQVAYPIQATFIAVLSDFSKAEFEKRPVTIGKPLVGLPLVNHWLVCHCKSKPVIASVILTELLIKRLSQLPTIGKPLVSLSLEHCDWKCSTRCKLHIRSEERRVG